MINLLPDETKKQLRAAHANVLLFKCLLTLGSATVFLIIACGTSYLFLANTRSDREKAQQNLNASAAVISTYQKQLDTIRADALVAQDITSKQTSYSNIITQIAAALPTGVVLDKLSLSSVSLNSPISLKMHAKSEEIATSIQTNFAKSALFSNYSQTTTAGNNEVSGYPIKVTATVIVNRGVNL